MSNTIFFVHTQASFLSVLCLLMRVRVRRLLRLLCCATFHVLATFHVSQVVDGSELGKMDA